MLFEERPRSSPPRWRAAATHTSRYGRGVILRPMSVLLDAWRHTPTHRKVWALAAPMILSNLSVPLVTLVDTAVIGHLPHTQQLGAVVVGEDAASQRAFDQVCRDIHPAGAGEHLGGGGGIAGPRQPIARP